MTSGEQEQANTADQQGEQPHASRPRKKYSAPRVLSAEPLETAAATCDPPAGAFGKSVPFPCGTLGS